MIRIFRIPYYYIPDILLFRLHGVLHLTLGIVHDIHNDIPNINHGASFARAFQYHPSFLRWAHQKAAAEMTARANTQHNSPLTDGMLALRSRPIQEFLPPTDEDLAQEAIMLLEFFRRRPGKLGRIRLPQSYVELARNFYGYTPEQASLEGVAELSGHHRDNDSGWYQLQDEA